MTENEARAAILAILVEELSVVTETMIEAGSQALTASSIEFVRRPNGQVTAMPRDTTESERLAAVWGAMVRAKLAPPVR